MLTTCPFCGKRNDDHTGVRGHIVPEDGDVSICIGCGQLAVFDHDALRAPTDDESDEFARDAGIQKYLAVWREVVRKHPH
ncbi:hypothetical protein DPV79_16025 [Burkholderia reimsis]|uniref:Uncharacterized protein n=1 Tax=Burkholderia reimsis TaxID=2234132 RepID=A0A365QUR4_9BURK|nr:hypothetical protein DPV79_16025 [Burkholderia reimsis]